MPDDLVYAITKAVFENINDLQAVHPAASQTTVDFTLTATPVPLHPGAIRYYEEVGAVIPDRLPAMNRSVGGLCTLLLLVVPVRAEVLSVTRDNGQPIAQVSHAGGRRLVRSVGTIPCRASRWRTAM